MVLIKVQNSTVVLFLNNLINVVSDESFTGEIGYKYMIIIIALALIVIGITGAIVYYGLVQIPASPPHVAVVQGLRERRNWVKGEGWRFFFGYPFLMDFVLVDRSNINVDFSPEQVRTPDNAELDIRISLTFHPDYQNPESLNVYLDNKGEAGVTNILKDVVSQRVLQWARSTTEGPQTWQEAQGKIVEAIEVILQKILGVNELTEEQKQNFTRGAGNCRLPSFGIVLDRLNVDKIAITGEMAAKAQKAAGEILEREAEIIELDHIGDRMNALKEKTGLSILEAANFVMADLGKVTKQVNDHNYKVQFPRGTGKALEEIAPLIRSALRGDRSLD